MKVFIMLLGLLIIISCGDSDDPDITLPTEYLPPPVDQSPAAEFFKSFKDTLTDEEIEIFLENVETNCKEDDSSSSALTWRLRNRLSEKALTRIYSNDDNIWTHQAAHLTTHDRLRVAAYFKYQPADPYSRNYLKDVHFEHDYVIYQFFDVFRFSEIIGDKNTRGWSGSTKYSESLQSYLDNFSDGGYLNLPDNLMPMEVKEVYKHIYNNWANKGIIDVPQREDYIDLISYYLIIFDQNDKLLFPVSERVVKHINDAPQATDAEIALYNRIYTPYAYDCVEEY